MTVPVERPTSTEEAHLTASYPTQALEERVHRDQVASAPTPAEIEIGRGHFLESGLRLLGTPLFDARLRHHLPLEEYMHLNIARMRAIFRAGLVHNDMWLGQRDQHRFRDLCGLMGLFGAYDFALGATITDHLIAGNALFTHGDHEQVARYRDEIVRLDDVYAFCCTEFHGGTNLRDINTTATYDRQGRRLILQSPTPASCKFWIGNALHAATVGMVLARLIVDGRDEGHHWFRVPLRDRENGPLRPNIRLVACDPKGGIHANQVAGLRFDNVVLPLDAMMRRFSCFTRSGEFRSVIPSAEGRFIRSIETFLQERLFPLAGARGAAEVAVFITWRFAHHRVIAHSPSRRTLISEPLFLQRLYPELLRTLALGWLEQTILDRFERDWHNEEMRKELHLRAAVGKSVGSWMGLEVLGKCREMCASQGFHHYNQIVTLRTDSEVNVTFAGDNSVMAYQVAKNAVRHPRWADAAPVNLGQRVEREIVERCRARSEGGFTHGEAVALTYARALGMIVEHARSARLASEAIIRDVEQLFAASYLPSRAAAPGSLEATRAKVTALADLLRPPSELVTAPIAGDDYIDVFTAPLFTATDATTVASID